MLWTKHTSRQGGFVIIIAWPPNSEPPIPIPRLWWLLICLLCCIQPAALRHAERSAQKSKLTHATFVKVFPAEKKLIPVQYVQSKSWVNTMHLYVESNLKNIYQEQAIPKNCHYNLEHLTLYIRWFLSDLTASHQEKIVCLDIPDIYMQILSTRYTRLVYLLSRYTRRYVLVYLDMHQKDINNFFLVGLWPFLYECMNVWMYHLIGGSTLAQR